MAAAALSYQLAPRRLVIGGDEVLVQVRRSARARVARVIVGPRRPLEAVIPRGMTMREFDQFLGSKRSWISSKLAAVETIVSRPSRLELDQANTVWIGGEAIPVMWQPGSRSVARRTGEAVEVGGEDVSDAVAALLRLYRREARETLRQVVEREARRLDLQARSVAVRDQQTRWGSCSSRGNLSFSWRLILAPQSVLEYVVVHELCHLREPSHAKRYWQILNGAYPGLQEPARWLREHGHELHRHTPVVA
jgi:predicted metal-dependent hydrolase